MFFKKSFIFLRTGLAWQSRRLFLPAWFALAVSGCGGGDGTSQVLSGSFGLGIEGVSGGGQVAPPGELFANPAVVKVVDTKGLGVSGVGIEFRELTQNGLFITRTLVITDGNGLASTNVRAPATFDTSATMRACIASSTTCTDFQFASNSTSENIEYLLLTQNSFNEVAGQPFTMQVITVDSETKSPVTFNGLKVLRWIWNSAPSWTGRTPINLPVVTNCIFVAGVCDIPLPITLMDSTQPTLVVVGDGDGGFIDFPLGNITVAQGPDAAVVVTDGPGGDVGGAEAIANVDYSVDDPPAQFYAAITDIAGNYKRDAATAAWSSSRPVEITDNLSTLNGPTTTLNFEESIPVPGFGQLYALVPGFPIAATGNLRIFPGVAVDVNLVPRSAVPPYDLYTRVGGEEFEFDLIVTDSRGNVVDSARNGIGFTGRYDVTLSFSNYQSGPQVTGGGLPMVHQSGMYARTQATRVLVAVDFFGGRTNFANQVLTFFDATSVTPTVNISVATPTEPLLPDVNGQSVFNMVVGPPERVMLRDALGPGGNSLCVANYSVGFNQLTWTTLTNLMRNDYQSTAKEVCPGLNLQAGDPDRDLYLSIEDKGGNFIANLNGDWITEDLALGDSLLHPQISGTRINSNTVNFDPDNATGGSPSVEYLRVQTNYLGTPYDQYFRGRVRTGNLAAFDLFVYRTNTGPGDWDKAIATSSNRLIIIPKDDQGNELVSDLTRDLDITVTGTFNNAPNGTAPVFLSSGSYPAVNFTRLLPTSDRDNVSDTTVIARFDGLITPNAGDVVNITVTDQANPSITASLNWRVVTGLPSQGEIWLGGAPGVGTNVTNQNFTLTADDTTSFYSVTKDAYGNNIPVQPSWVLWSQFSPFPAGAYSLFDVSVPNPLFRVDRPGSGILNLNISASQFTPFNIRTGTITLVPGVPDYLEVEIDATNFVAGSDRVVTVRVKDQKGNTVTSINGPLNMTFNVLGNSPTALGFQQDIPPNGPYIFVNGEYTFPAGAFRFYNANENPIIQVTTTINSDVVGGNSDTLFPEAGPFDHLGVRVANPTLFVGTVNRYTIQVEDQYGNKLGAGPISTSVVDFTITSSLGDEDIVGSSLLAASIIDFAPLNQKVISGQLFNGEAWIDVYGERAGLVTVDGFTLAGGNMANNVEQAFVYEPLSAINSIRFSSIQPPPATASTIFSINSFGVELVDALGNLITTNSSAQVSISVISGNSTLTGTTTNTANSGTVLFTNLRYTRAEVITLRASLVGDPTKFVDHVLDVQVGTPNRTLVILPEQVWTEGTGSLASAVTGNAWNSTTPNARVAGNSFTVQVRAVDNAFNTNTSYSGPVSISSTDPYLEVLSGPTNFAAGVANFNVRVRQRGAAQNIFAVSGLSVNHPSSNYSVAVGAVTQLAVLLPGQALLQGAPNVATAIDQLVPDQTAGVAFNARVLALDAYFNHNTSYNHGGTIGLVLNSDPLATPPANQSLTGGEVTFSVVNFRGIPGLTVRPNVVSGPALTTNTSEVYEVKGGVATQFVAYFPDGQTFHPGQAPGNYAGAVQGTPLDQDTDGGFSVIVLAVDNYFNQDVNYTGAVSVNTPDDPNDVPPAASNFSGGSATFTINPVRAADNQSLVVNAPGLAVNTPALYDVKPGAPAKLIVLFNDYQTLNQGGSTFASVVPNQTVQTRTSNQAVSVTVYATDNLFNVVDDDSTVVSLNHTVASQNISITPATRVLSNGSASFTVQTYLVGSPYTITPNGGSYAGTPSTQYQVSFGPSNQLLVIMPGQTFSPGRATAALAANGNPVRQTQGAGFPFTVQVYAVDDFFNHRTTANETVTITPALGHVVSGGNSQSMASTGLTSFTLHHTASSPSTSILATATGGYTSNTSKGYEVLANLGLPTLSLSDVNTGSTAYVRQVSTLTAIGSDATAYRWCLSESQTTRPSTGTNIRTACVGGGGTDNGWYTSRPSSINLQNIQGSRTVYLWVADPADNVSLTPVTDSIILDSVAPGTPTILGASGGTDSVVDAFLTANLSDPTLSWTNVTGEDGYRISITDTSNVPIAGCGPVNVGADVTSYDAFAACNLADNTNYRIAVVAFDDAGNERAATPFGFRTTVGVDNFLVELVPASNPVAGNGFSVRLTARRANNELASTYAGLGKSISWSSNGSTGTDVCSVGAPQAPEFGSSSVDFVAGVATIPNFKMKVAQGGVNITAHELDTPRNASGTSANFSVTPSTVGCIRFETAAGGSGSPVAGGATAIDTRVTVHAAGRDVYGNFVADQSVNWTGTGVLANMPYPTVGTSTTIVGVEAGTGLLQESGGQSLSFTFTPGVRTYTSATTDANGSTHLANNTINAIAHWDVMADAVTGWRTNSALSWHSEAQQVNDRSQRDDFPRKVHLVGTNSGLDIFDATSNELFMRFQAGSNRAVDSNLGVIFDIAALNGKIFLSMNGGSGGGLIIIDLAQDEVYKINNASRLKATSNLAARNNSLSWSVDTTYPLLTGTALNKIVAKRFSGKDYVAFGHNAGVDILNISDATLTSDATANAVFAVDFDNSGTLYYGEDNVGLHRADSPLSGNFSPDRTYNLATGAELVQLNLNDVSVAPGASSHGGGFHAVSIASDLGLTLVHENASVATSSSRTYSTRGFGNVAFDGALSFLGTDGFVSLADGASGLGDTATVELWFKPASTPTNRVLFDKGNGAEGAMSLYFNASGNLVFEVIHNGTPFRVTSSANSWNNNQWYHVAAIVNGPGDRIQAWVDGTSIGSNTTMDFGTPALALDTSASTLGGLASGAHFNGFIDEFRLKSNVQYAGGTISVPTSAFTSDGTTVHLLHFDEPSGDTAFESDNGANENGLLNGGVYFVRPLFLGSSESIHNLDSFFSGSLAVHFVTSGGWHDYVGFESTPTRQDDSLGINAVDVKIINKTSATNNDAAIGLATGGLRLNRR